MEISTAQLLESIVKDRDTCSLMSALFVSVTSEMKNSQAYWEDLIKQGLRLHSSLKSTLLAMTSYFDSLQRIADSANSTKGSTREIGSAITRICLRHRAVEARVKTLTSSLIDCLINPLQDKFDEWRKNVCSLEKEQIKEYKRNRTELKKRATDVVRLSRKAQKLRTQNLQRSVDKQSAEVQLRYQRLEEKERALLSSAMIEERSRYCKLVSCLKPMVEMEIGIVDEMSQLGGLMNKLECLADDPFSLPAASQQVLLDLKGAGDTFRLAPVTSVPQFAYNSSTESSIGSRKSSLCSLTSNLSCSSSSQLCQPALCAVPSPDLQQDTQRESGAATHLRVSPATSSSGRDEQSARNTDSLDSGFVSETCILPTGDPAADTPCVRTSVDTECVYGGRNVLALGSLRSSTKSRPLLSSGLFPRRTHTISSAYERARLVGAAFSSGRAPLTSRTFIPSHKHISAPPSVTTTTSEQPTQPVSSSKESRRASVSNYALPERRPCLPDFHKQRANMVVPMPIYANLAEYEAQQQLSCVNRRVSFTLRHHISSEQVSRQQTQSQYDQLEPSTLTLNHASKDHVTLSNHTSADQVVTTNHIYSSHVTSADIEPPAPPIVEVAHLPAPPDFLLEDTYSEDGEVSALTVTNVGLHSKRYSMAYTAESLNADCQRKSGGESLRRCHSQTARTLHPPPLPSRHTPPTATTDSPHTPRAGAVSAAVKSLTAMGHRPASPTVLAWGLYQPHGARVSTVSPPLPPLLREVVPQTSQLLNQIQQAAATLRRTH